LGVIGAPRSAEAACAVPAFVEASYNGSGAFGNQPNAPYSNGWGRSGDYEYSSQICDSGMIDGWVWAYSMDQGNWDDGRGWEAPCDIAKMLGRTFVGLYILNSSEEASNQASTWDDLSGLPLRWAGNYAHLAFDELDGECRWDSNATARTVRSPIDSYTDLFHGFVYSLGSTTRAGVLLHESRHADGYGHDGNDGSNPCVSRSDSCDESFTWDGGSGRANSYEVYWLNDFYYRGQYTTTWHKQMAKDRGNYVLTNRFDSVPTYRL
jgi:hypothetical protein